MSTARYVVGDVLDVLADMPDGSAEFVMSSPPFLALRSYLPADHADKAREHGGESTPAEWLDCQLAVIAECRRVLAPFGSLAWEVGDTYATSGGPSGDARGIGLLSGTRHGAMPPTPDVKQGDGWPEIKSLAMVPQALAMALAYGLNPLTGQPSPAGRWRVRNVMPWVRPNPPVGALGDKVRPATSYVIVACTARDRWFDLDAVRRPPSTTSHSRLAKGAAARTDLPSRQRDGNWSTLPETDERHPGGSPPLDWQTSTAAVIDAHLAGPDARRDGAGITKALVDAGVLDWGDALHVSPAGYTGAHFATFPVALVAPLVESMAPRRVCLDCGQPSRRITRQSDDYRAMRDSQRKGANPKDWDMHVGNRSTAWDSSAGRSAEYPTLGWSDCGCPGHPPLWDGDAYTGRLDGWHPGPGWRPGRVLDPYAGSGTTLVAATGLGREAVGIDIDARNADLARDRLGMFLELDA